MTKKNRSHSPDAVKEFLASNTLPVTYEDIIAGCSALGAVLEVAFREDRPIEFLRDMLGYPDQADSEKILEALVHSLQRFGDLIQAVEAETLVEFPKFDGEGVEGFDDMLGIAIEDAFADDDPTIH